MTKHLCSNLHFVISVFNGINDTSIRTYVRTMVYHTHAHYLYTHVRTYTYVCRFLDKLYCLSSVNALMEFTRCPRRYLLDPLPVVPCKICIVGPPRSGRTTLAGQLAEHYEAEVINLWEQVIPLQEKARQENIARVEAEETANAISLISNKLKGTMYVCVCMYVHLHMPT